MSWKNAKKGLFDARGTLTPLARPKKIFNFFFTFRDDKALNYEQIKPFYGTLAQKVAEKNVSNQGTKIYDSWNNIA